MPSSLRSIIEEKPTTSAARIAARRRVVILQRVPSSCVNTPLLSKRAMTEPGRRGTCSLASPRYEVRRYLRNDSKRVEAPVLWFAGCGLRAERGLAWGQPRWGPRQRVSVEWGPRHEPPGPHVGPLPHPPRELQCPAPGRRNYRICPRLTCALRRSSCSGPSPSSLSPAR